MIKSFLFALILLLFLTSCQKDEICEKHDLRLDSYDLITNQVQAYDMNMNREVSITYTKGLFKMTNVELYQSQYDHPILTLLYDNYNYYSL